MDISKLNELETLVGMAEEVSETISLLHSKIANLRVMLMLSTIGLYSAAVSVYFVFKNPGWLSNLPFTLYIALIFLAFFLVMGSFFYIYKYLVNIKSYKRKLDIEIKIMHRLLIMVHEYKEYIYDKEMSYVEKAILEMKLERIMYSSKW